MNAREMRFSSDERGGITVLCLFLLVAVMLVGGIALDTANAVKTRANLQIAADMAAHAALAERTQSGSAASQVVGLDYARRNAPTNARKVVLKTGDIEFGTWNGKTRTFVPVATADRAVRVTARMDRADGNGLRTFLMKLIGKDALDLTAVSVWAIGPGPCINGGFTANGIVDMRGNNAYDKGFCVHSNTHVEFQQKNLFEDGVTVSMPHEGDLVIPKSGFVQNVGLQAALRSMSTDLSDIFDKISTTADRYKDPLDPSQPSYVTRTTANSVDAGKSDLTANMLEKYAVNIVKCSGKTLTIGKNETIENAVIVTDCKVQISQGAALQDALLVTTNGDARSVNAPNGLRLGTDDSCAPGGGAQILTLGGMQVAAGLEAYGSQVIALGDIGFTANATGVEGLNMISNGEIDGTSNGKMGFCDDEGMDRIIELDKIRMVM